MKNFKVIIVFDDGEVMNRTYHNWEEARRCYLNYKEVMECVNVRVFDMEDEEEAKAYEKAIAKLNK